jgi:hypothetical protein
MVTAALLAGCAPVSTVGDPAPPVVSTIPGDTAVTSSTAAPAEPGSDGPSTTTTTLPDPTGDFLDSLLEAPAVTAVVSTGFRRWDRQDGVWLAGPLTTFADGPYAEPPFVAATEAGLVHGSPGGTVYLDDEPVAPDAGTLSDVAVSGDVVVAIVIEGGTVTAVNLADGSSHLLYEGAGEVSSASYAEGNLLVVRGTGGEAVVNVVSGSEPSRALDLLTDGNPVSAVVTPDGATMVFSTDVEGEATVYTLPLGSQGPAAAHPLSVEGRVSGLDTDGDWVAGQVDDRSFLLDLGTGSVFVGPPNVRFVFDRADRNYVGPGVDRVLDGRFFGFVRSADGEAVVFDEAEFLTGEDAARAAEDAGEESPPPNDFFIRNSRDETQSIPLSADPDVRIQGDVLQAGIGLEPVTLAQWLLLLEGDTSVIDFDWYGAGALPYWITIESGRIVAIEEVYLP